MSSDLPIDGLLQRAGTFGTVACFSMALALSSVALPLVMVQTGYSTAEVGFFIALSAVTQIAVRYRLIAMMRRVPDKHLVGLAATSLALGCGVIVVSGAGWVILLSQLLVGAGRGLFWTGIQTHAVRTSRKAARGLALVNLASGVGLVTGPALAGVLLEDSAQTAMGVGAAIAAAVWLPVVVMARLPVLSGRSGSSTDVSHRLQIRHGAWATASAGGWRGLMNAYVPVVLHESGEASSVIGAIVAAANGATILAGWTARWVPISAATLVAGTLVTGLSMGMFGLTSRAAGVAVAALIASALGAGLLQTVGPAFAAEAVQAAERGNAMATVGLCRAGATLGVPLGVAGLLTAIPVTFALAAAGAVLGLPAAHILRSRAVHGVRA